MSGEIAEVILIVWNPELALGVDAMMRIVRMIVVTEDVDEAGMANSPVGVLVVVLDTA